MTPQQLAGLRSRLVAHLRARGDLRTERVAAAFERVPRHLFLPALPPKPSTPTVRSRSKCGTAFRSARPRSRRSWPRCSRCSRSREGERVLEIGTGSGYNAALLAELVGTSGFVETIDIDADLVAAARAHLDGAGYARVRTVCADGAHGDPAGARCSTPSSRRSASRGSRRPGSRSCASGGRLVAPLTIGATQKVVAFERTAAGLETRAIVDAAFMMLRGPFATGRTRASSRSASRRSRCACSPCTPARSTLTRSPRALRAPSRDAPPGAAPRASKTSGTGSRCGSPCTTTRCAG